MKKTLTTLAVALAALSASTALAAPKSTSKAPAEPARASAGYSLPKAGDWLIRGRALGVVPDESANITGAVTGHNIEIDNSVVPEFDFSYFVTENVAVELVTGVTPHSVKTNTSSAGALDLGDVWLLPPTLTAQYHLTNLGRFKPYAGAGVNYTHFFGADRGNSVTSVHYGDSFGPALQAGADYALDDHWMLNVDVKKLWINSDVKFNGGAIKADVDIDPMLIGVGVGYHF